MAGTLTAMVSLLLLRHGQSTWNAAQRWQGQADPPLSDLGRRQATVAGSALDGPIDGVWASDLRRAADTALAVAAAHNSALTALLPALRERAAGAWEGRTRVEIEEGWPGYLADGRRPPGYETDDAIVERVLPELDRLAARGGERLVVVSHGGVIRAVQRHLSGSDSAVPNLGGSWLHHDGGWMLGDSVELASERTITGLE